MDLQTGVSYNFNSTAPGLLGVSFTNAKLIGILNYDMANHFDNIYLKWRTIFPLLPTGTPNSPESFTYYYFQLESGEKVILAEPWISESTVEAVGSISIGVVLNGASLLDIGRIRDALNAMNYTNYTIKQL